MAANIQFNVDAALAKLGELVQQHGPQVVDTAAQVVQINAINTLSGVVGWGVMALASAWAVKWCWRQTQDGEELWVIGLCASAAATGGFLLGAATCLFDVWAWVALFNPKLALAHAVLAKLGGL